jgi:hypothetical protein
MNATTAHPIMHSTMAAPFRCQGRPCPRVSASAATAAMTSHSGTNQPQAEAWGELVHQPGERDHPGLVGTLRVTGVHGVVAEGGDPELLGQDRGHLPDAHQYRHRDQVDGARQAQDRGQCPGHLDRDELRGYG